MVKFLIASHGYLADGLKSTLEIIVGKEIAERVSTLNAFVDENSGDFKGNIEKYMNQVSSEDQLIIFSDIMHGSVNQCLMSFIDDERIFLITGVNFPLLCEIVAEYSFTEDAQVHKDDLQNAVVKAKEEMIFVNNFITTVSSKDSEDDFFE